MGGCIFIFLCNIHIHPMVQEMQVKDEEDGAWDIQTHDLCVVNYNMCLNNIYDEMFRIGMGEWLHDLPNKILNHKYSPMKN